MSKSALATGFVFLGLTTLAGAASWAAPAPQTVLKAKDHQKIGRRFADYFEATEAEKGVHDALEKVQKELEKFGKKHGDDPLQGALSLSGDLGKSLWYATDYSKAARKIKSGGVESKELDIDDQAVTYAVMAPAKYKVKDGPYPLILAIPGLTGGENQKASDHLIEDWKDNDLNAAAFIVAVDMPADEADWNKIIEPASDGGHGGIARLMYVFREMRETVAIDFDRVYIAGRGPGGVDGALRLANMFPHLFAGVIGRAGDAPEMDVTNFRNLPIFFAGAGAGATKFQEGANAAGFGDLIRIDPAGDEKTIWAWIQDNPRRSNPLHVSLRPGSPIPNKSYWLEVPPQQSSEDNLVEAVIDRETNTITITGKGVSNVTLYLNDQLVDLGRPVKFVCNGIESEQQIQRNLSDALRFCDRGQNDPGRFYVALRKFELAE